MVRESSIDRLRDELIRRTRLERRGNNTGGEVEGEASSQQVEMQQNRMDNSERSQRRTMLPLVFGWRGRVVLRDEEAASERIKAVTATRPSRFASFRSTPRAPPSQLPASLPISSGVLPAPALPRAAAVAGSTVAAMPAASMNTESIGAQQPGQTRHVGWMRHGRRAGKNSKAKRFLFCFPYVKSSQVRGQIAQCFVAGLFLIMLLAVYLGLALTKNVVISELNIMMIMTILLAAIFFCYSIVRLYIIAVRGGRRQGVIAKSIDPHGYAVPRTPIRVMMAQDEDAVGLESQTTKTKPPAYGLWRESVRVDPNRFFWQRNEAAEAVPSLPTTTVFRPPSYASEDGVSYVIEAVPRSIAPSSTTVTVTEPEPTHPSEVGRAGQSPLM